MLFDLSSGRRKRVVQVVYTVLAVMMGGSLLLLGIGSDAPGGLLDAVGLGSNGDSSGSTPQYEEQIENAQEKLAADPENQQALLALVRYFTLSATASGVQTDPTTGQTSVTEDARSDLESSVQAWQDYLALKPERANAAAAASAVQAYQLLLDAGGAAEAQQVVADAQKTAAALRPARLLPLRGLPVPARATPPPRRRSRRPTRPTARRSRRASRRSPNGRASRRSSSTSRPSRTQQSGGDDAAAPGLTDPFGALGTESAGGSTTAPPVTPAPAP